MEKPKKIKSEEELEKRRIARRIKYQELKNNPEKYAVEQAQKRKNYLNRKIEKKVKSITEMTQREQNKQREIWRKNSKRYHGKKVGQHKILEVTVSEGRDDSTHPILSVDMVEVEQSKKIKSEEKVEKRRIARRRKYQELKNNQEKYAAEQDQKRLNYLKRKIEKKVKSITEMTQREQNLQRKIWRKNSKRYQGKKVEERKILEVTVSEGTDGGCRSIDEEWKEETSIDEEWKEEDPLKGGRDNLKVQRQIQITERELELKRKIKTMKMRHLKEKISMLKTLRNYKYRCAMLQEQVKILSEKDKDESKQTDFIEFALPPKLENLTADTTNPESTSILSGIVKVEFP